MTPVDGLPQFKTMPGLARAFRRWAEKAEVSILPKVPGANATEQHLLGALGGIAAAVGDRHIERWPTSVQLWASTAPAPPDDLTDAVREGLGNRIDPLAVLYDASISSANRRRLGTVFTPAAVVQHMLSLAAGHLEDAPACVIEPGAGSGAFTIAAARRWPRTRIVAVDVNVVTLGLLAARIGFETDAEPHSAKAMRRIELVLGDYLDQLHGVYAADPRGPVAAIGNPPYTRVQELPTADRLKAAEAASRVIDNGHANLAILFQAATLARMRPHDISCMVLPGSLSYTRASRGLRRTLWESRRPVEVQRTPATTRAFRGRSVQAAILAVGPERKRRPPLRLARVEVHNPSINVLQSWTLPRSQPEPENWFHPDDVGQPGDQGVPLAEIATVRRGVATGAKEMFFLTDELADTLPGEVITAGIPTLRGFDGEELTVDSHATYGDANTRRWLLAIPPEHSLTGPLREYVARHDPEVKNRYLPSQRKPWYSLTALLWPQLLISPLARVPFKVVLNTVRAVPSNNVFGITLKAGGDPAALANWLRSREGQAELRRVSRRYHGGSHKLEPRNLGAIRVPKSAHIPG